MEQPQFVNETPCVATSRSWRRGANRVIPLASDEPMQRLGDVTPYRPLAPLPEASPHQQTQLYSRLNSYACPLEKVSRRMVGLPSLSL